MAQVAQTMDPQVIFMTAEKKKYNVQLQKINTEQLALFEQHKQSVQQKNSQRKKQINTSLISINAQQLQIIHMMSVIQNYLLQKKTPTPATKALLEKDQLYIMENYLEELGKLYKAIESTNAVHPDNKMITWLKSASNNINNQTPCGGKTCYEILSCILADPDLIKIENANPMVRNLRAHISSIGLNKLPKCT